MNNFYYSIINAQRVISNNSINLSELSQGLYIIKISAGDRTQAFKITKE